MVSARPQYRRERSSSLENEDDDQVVRAVVPISLINSVQPRYLFVLVNKSDIASPWLACSSASTNVGAAHTLCERVPRQFDWDH